MTTRRAVKIAARIVLGVLVFGIAGIIVLLALISWRKPDSVTLPKPGGPYAVGRVFFDWVDPNRIDPLAPTPGISREITGWIWYPAAPSSQPAAEYIPRPVRNALIRQANPLVARVARALTVDQANVYSHALEGAALSQEPPAFPVVLMKPGYGGLAVQYSALAEDLASYGYVVVGSNSPYTTTVVVYQDGRIATRTPAGHPSESAPGRRSELAPGQPNDLMLPVAKVWEEDMRFVLDRLSGINISGFPEMFSGRLDLQSVGAFGHSFGGGVSLQFCKDDARCKGAVDIDGAIWGDVAFGGLTKPALFLFSDRPIFKTPLSDLNPDQKSMMKALERIRADLPNQPNEMVLLGTSHYNFSDSAFQVGPRVGRFLGTIGSIDPLRAMNVTRRYVRAFFDTYLKGNADNLLQNASPDYPEVLIE